MADSPSASRSDLRIFHHRSTSVTNENIGMSEIDNLQEPIFLDGENESPQELPLMVTRHTLRSRGLAKNLLDQLSAGATTDEQTGKSHQTIVAPNG